MARVFWGNENILKVERGRGRAAVPYASSGPGKGAMKAPAPSRSGLPPAAPAQGPRPLRATWRPGRREY